MTLYKDNLDTVPQLPHIVNAAILLSAWSAAAADIYISSRFLYFLAKRGHAPSIFAFLTKYPTDSAQRNRTTDTSDYDSEDDMNDTDSDTGNHQQEATGSSPRAQNPDGDWVENERHGSDEETGDLPNRGISNRAQAKRPQFVLPLAAVLGSASVSFLCFLGLRNDNSKSGAQNVRGVPPFAGVYDPGTFCSTILL